MKTGTVGGDQPHVLVLADDLSGAAEAAAAFIRARTWCRGPAAPRTPAPARHGSRSAHSTAFGRRRGTRCDTGAFGWHRRAGDHQDRFAAARPRRGHRPRRTGNRAPVIVAAGNPALGRTVVGGVVLVDGIPLVETGLWGAESAAPPRSIADAVGYAPGVRIVDITSDGDLDRVVAQALPHDNPDRHRRFDRRCRTEHARPFGSAVRPGVAPHRPGRWHR